MTSRGGSEETSGIGELRGRRRVGVLLAVAATVLLLDIVTKVIVVATLRNGKTVPLLGGLVTLRVERNPGAAFSIGPSLTVVFALIAVSVVVFILRTSRQIRSLAWAVTLGLLLGGATGNLTDRLLRSPGPFRGYVVDWIQLPHWPVFNVADSSIVCGGVLAVLLAMRNVRIDGTRPPMGRHSASGSSDPGQPGSGPDGSGPDGTGAVNGEPGEGQAGPDGDAAGSGSGGSA